MAKPLRKPYNPKRVKAKPADTLTPSLSITKSQGIRSAASVKKLIEKTKPVSAYVVAFRELSNLLKANRRREVDASLVMSKS